MTGPVSVSAKGILFDMDGVLVSSIGSAQRSWRRWAERYGIPNAATLEVPHGRRAIDIVRWLRPDIDPQAGLKVIEDLEVADVADLRVLPGVKGLLASLPPERWAIVTSAQRRLLLTRLTVASVSAAGDVADPRPPVVTVVPWAALAAWSAGMFAVLTLAGWLAPRGSADR